MDSVKILIIDDNEIDREILAFALTECRNILEAKNGKEGLALAKQTPHPDLILLDILMPIMDGYEVIKQLKSDPLTKDIPVVFITSKVENADEAYGLQLGAADYIYKPLKVELIRLRVTNLLKLQQSRQALVERERFYRGITEAMGDGLFIQNKEGDCIFINPKAEHILGWAAADILGKNFHDIAHYCDHEGNSLPRDDCPINKCIEQNKSYSSDDVLLYRKDGSFFPASMTAVPLFAEGEYTNSVVVFQDVTVRKENEKALILAKKVADEANHAKSNFLANMSHELRTPLHGILSYAVMGETRAGSVDREKLKRYFSNINTSGSRLLALLNDLLDISKLEAGKMTMAIKDNSVKSLILNCHNELLAKMQEQGIHFTLKNEETMIVQCDGFRIQQVIINLLSNALKFSPTGSEISVEYVQIDNKIQIKIIDQGPGLETKNLTKIFNKFTQAGVTDTGLGMGSTGLGLSISKGIIKAHHGKIWAENSVDKKVGGIFCFTLPLIACNKVDIIGG